MNPEAAEITRVTVLTNPASGHGNAPHAAERAVTRFQQHGIDVTAIVGRDAPGRPTGMRSAPTTPARLLPPQTVLSVVPSATRDAVLAAGAIQTKRPRSIRPTCAQVTVPRVTRRGP